MGETADRNRRDLGPPEGETLDRLYGARFSASDRESKRRLWGILCRSFFQRYVRATDVVLDLGAGFCDFSNNIRAGQKIAVDLNPATSRHADADVEVYQIPLDGLSERIAASSVDLAFASNALEHLRSPDELLRVLNAVAAVLRPGGRIIVLQPNVRLVGGRFWDFFDHTLPLTEKGMEEALLLVGFEVVESRAGFLPYTTKSALPQWPWLIRLYLGLRPLQWLFGRQMLIVARKGA